MWDWQETLSQERTTTEGAAETVTVPFLVLKGHVLGVGWASNRFATSVTALGKKLSVAFDAIRKILLSGKLFTRKGLVTVLADEAVTVPRLISVPHACFRDWLLAMGTAHGNVRLVARAAIVSILAWEETLSADWTLALLAQKALVMPDLPFILHPLGTWRYWLAAHLAPCSQFRAITLRTN